MEIKINSGRQTMFRCPFMIMFCVLIDFNMEKALVVASPNIVNIVVKIGELYWCCLTAEECGGSWTMVRAAAPRL